MTRLFGFLVFFLGLGAVAIKADPVSLIEPDGANIALTHDAADRKTVRVPVILTNEEDKALFARLVLVKHDEKREQIEAYRACTRAPTDGSGIWTVELSTTQEAFAIGTHDMSVLMWTDQDPRTAQADCDGKPLIKEVRTSRTPVTTCASETCQWLTFTITAAVAPKEVRKGNLIELVNGSMRILPYNDAGEPRAADYSFAPGEQVDPTKLWIFQASTTASDGSTQEGVFKACITDPQKSGTNLPQIKLTPEPGATFKVATYSVTLDLVQGDNRGFLCDMPGKIEPGYEPETCKAAQEAGKELKCQRITLQLERKQAVLDTPTTIRINITRFPFVEMISGIEQHHSDGRSFGDWPARHHPFKIRETSFAAAADLSRTETTAELSRSNHEKEIVTVTFSEPRLIGPGQVKELEPKKFELPVGLNSYGSYSGTIKVASANATAQEKSVNVRLDIRMSQIALVLAIILGIVAGYFYRKRFENELERDRELVQARYAMDKLIRARQTTRDATFLSELEDIIESLRTVMHNPDAVASAIKTEREAAIANLETAQSNLREAVEAAGKSLDPWSASVVPRSPEPETVVRALAPLREHVSLLRSQLSAQNATEVMNRDGIHRLPDLTKQGLGVVKSWVDSHAPSLNMASERWDAVRDEYSDTKQFRKEIFETQGKLDEALATTPNQPQTAAALAALSRMLYRYDTTMRHHLVEALGPFLIALDVAAREAMADQEKAAAEDPNVEIIQIPSGQMIAGLNTLQSVAAVGSVDWPVAEYARAAIALHEYTADVAHGLAKLKRLGDGEVSGNVDAVKKAYEAWKRQELSVKPASEPPEAAQDARHSFDQQAAFVRYRVVAPSVVHAGEVQLWTLESIDPAADMPEDIKWFIGQDDDQQQEVAASGPRVYLRIDNSTVVSVAIEADQQTLTLNETVNPVMTKRLTNIDGLQARIRSTVRNRTIVNGVLITIFGAVALDQFQAGYLGLVLAMVYGMAADVSADRLSTILGAKPKAPS